MKLQHSEQDKPSFFRKSPKSIWRQFDRGFLREILLNPGTGAVEEAKATRFMALALQVRRSDFELAGV